MNARYLGDGVYASFNECQQIVLTTGHHDPAQADNTIYLEAEVYQALAEYVTWLNTEALQNESHHP